MTWAVEASSGTTYVYSTSGTGAVTYAVNIPSSGTYKMTASVSAPNAASNSWNVQILGALDIEDYANQYTVVQSLGTVLHTEDVNGHIGGISTRYWNLNAGTYMVIWGGRAANCALACFTMVQTSTSFMSTATPTATKTITPTATTTPTGTWYTATNTLSPTQTITSTPTTTPTKTATLTRTATNTRTPTSTLTPTSTFTPSLSDTCGYLADGSGVSSPLAVATASDGTTYIYSTTGAGSQSYSVNVPSSGAYKISASVSAPNVSSNTWNVQIQGALDTYNYANQYTVVQSLGTALHTEDVNGHIGGISTRYWNLNAGNYVVTWAGRSANCALACFNLVQVSGSFLPTVTPIPTNTPTSTPTPNTGGQAREGDQATPTGTVTNWNGRVVIAAPNISVSGEPVNFKVNLQQSAPIQINLYNILGERVYSANLSGNAGLNQVEWDLVNTSGSQVASGLYIYQVHVGAVVYGGKVVVIH